MDYYCMCIQCILHITMEFIKKFNNAGKVVILINSNTSATIPKLKTVFAFRTGGALPRPKGHKAPLSRNSSVKVECIASFFSSCNEDSKSVAKSVNIFGLVTLITALLKAWILFSF